MLRSQEKVMARDEQLPKFYELMNPLLLALRDLGGSGSIEEIAGKVTESLDLPDAILNVPHDPEKSSQTEIEYRLAWARTYLKKFGLIDNSVRGVWVIVPEKREVETIDPLHVVRTVREIDRNARESNPSVPERDEDLPEEAHDWRSKLHQVLTKELSPDAFERLVKRMLRESGFVQVEVTGRSGDGGIDGKGIVRIGGILSFHVLFQCKRYQGSVSPSAIRDFRGALVGRADKGLFVTTGTFTREAIREASRDGAPPIDLMDGDQLADKLKALALGVRTEMVESVDVDVDWFRSL
jgi:restriction system protein